MSHSFGFEFEEGMQQELPISGWLGRRRISCGQTHSRMPDVRKVPSVRGGQQNRYVKGDAMQSNATPQNAPDQLAGDILKGADAIAHFLFGSREYRRKIYYLAERTKIPIFRLGSVLCARKSILMNYILEQESLFFEQLAQESLASSGPRDQQTAEA
jgi:hypothetical protein